MRSNHLLFPAVSLLGALLAVAAPLSTATAKTCFYNAVSNHSYSKQGKGDKNFTKEEGKPVAGDGIVFSLVDTGHVLPQFVDRSSRLALLGFAGNKPDSGLIPNFVTMPIENTFLAHPRSKVHMDLIDGFAYYNTDVRITGTEQPISDGQNAARSPLHNMAQSQDCQSIMKLHGFLTRAQFECGFNSYSDEMIQKARDCAQTLTESETMKLLASGMKAFDREERERGRARICQDVLRDFPGIIRK